VNAATTSACGLRRAAWMGVAGALVASGTVVVAVVAWLPAKAGRWLTEGPDRVPDVDLADEAVAR